jgi:hypothetical protein
MSIQGHRHGVGGCIDDRKVERVFSFVDFRGRAI